ncbi:MAG: hypothetical protein Q8L49_16285 [Burkholderiaceae bacterium]|nr:hypothetical protein [Burkholderiaceae bacterium]
MILRALRRLFEALIALVILFEEWGWEPLQRALAWIARLPPLAWIERRIVALPPCGALAVFLLPTLLLLPVKLAALWLIGIGKAGLGLALIVSAKLVGTALLARLFRLTQPALMQLAWFARWYGRWTVWKEGIVAQVRASWAWRVGRVIKRRVVQRLARWRHAG